MAVDKLVDSTQLDTDLTSVANAIRTKGGTSASLAFPAGFVSAIAAIPTGGGGGGLPSAYQEVEYIDAGNGGPYIVTNYTPVQDDEIHADIWQNVRPAVNNTFYCPFSAGTGTYQTILLFGYTSAVDKEIIYYKYFKSGDAVQAPGHTYTSSLQKTIVAPNGELIIDGVSKATSAYGGALDGGNTALHVFVRANLQMAFPGKIGRLFILNGTETKLYLVPCYRIADTVIGMYDMVSGTFYTNSGSGSFTKGSDVLSDADALELLLGG